VFRLQRTALQKDEQPLMDPTRERANKRKTPVAFRPACRRAGVQRRPNQCGTWKYGDAA